MLIIHLFLSLVFAQTLSPLEVIQVSSTHKLKNNGRLLNGQGIVVAVIDSGVDTSHPSLKNKIAQNYFETPGNGIDDDRNGYVDDVYGWNFISDNNLMYDEVGHGTHVAGLIVSDSFGVAPEARILPLKVLSAEGGTDLNVWKAIQYAVNRGAKVINLSLGSYGKMKVSKLIEEQIIAYARKHDVLVVTAAANDSNNNDLNPVFPASHMSDNILSICAVDQNNNLADFSNYGKLWVHLCAPGVNITSTVPYSVFGTFSSEMSGTSMATPYVSGVAALLYSGDITAKSYAIRAAIMDNTNKQYHLKDKSLTGGIVNAFSAALSLYGMRSVQW